MYEATKISGVIRTVEQIMLDNARRLTPQRRAVLAVLAARPGEHLTVEEICTAVRKLHAGTGLATVYRTLDLLEQMEVISYIKTESGQKRYELSPRWRHSMHHHLICLGCGAIIEVEGLELHDIYRQLAEKYGFTLTAQPVELWGYCSRCAGQVKGSAGSVS